MSIRNRLETMIDGLPPGSSVSLPVEWVRRVLEEEPETLPELLTLEDVARTVDRAVSTVRTWCNSGEMEGAFKLQGRDWRVPREALGRFLESQGGEKKGPSRTGPVDLGSWRDQRSRRSG